MTIEQIKNIFPDAGSIPEKFRIDYFKQTEYLINGEIRNWKGKFIEVKSPVCLKKNLEIKQQVIGCYPSFTVEEALTALDASIKAFDNGNGYWPKAAVQERINHVNEFISGMKEQKEKIVKLLMWEIGKNLEDSSAEFDRTIEYINDTIDALKELDRISSRLQIEKGIIGQIRRSPLGVVLCMGPFNYPLNETFTTLIPALITGNSVLFKPAKHGVLLLQPLLKLFKDCFPKGVVNTLYGEGRTLIGPVMETGKVDALAFIGSKKAANIIEKQHPAPNRLKTVLGLGAKNPAIVLKDADIDMTVKECLKGTLAFNGQRCTALKIIFIHDTIIKQFIEKFSSAVSALKIGMPWEENVKITPLPEDNKANLMKEFIDDAINFGAEIINENGGMINNTFLNPAVLFPVNNKMRIYHEEQFGPVIPLISFKNIEEPLNYIINSAFGQQVSIFGFDADKIAKLIDTLVNQVSRVNINTLCQRGPDKYPFTGRKDSAEGTLSVSDALRVFSIRTLVATREDDMNKKIFTEIIKERKSNFLNTDFIL